MRDTRVLRSPQVSSHMKPQWGLTDVHLQLLPVTELRGTGSLYSAASSPQHPALAAQVVGTGARSTPGSLVPLGR